MGKMLTLKDGSQARVVRSRRLKETYRLARADGKLLYVNSGLTSVFTKTELKDLFGVEI